MTRPTAPVSALLVAFGLAGATACAPSYRTETLGTARAGVGASDPGAAPEAIDIPVEEGDRYRLALRVDMPRAMLLRYAIRCGDATAEGSIGETFEAYEQRRLAELRAARDRQKRQVASVTGLVASQVGAHAEVDTPNAHGEAHVRADGEAVGAAVADRVVEDDVSLPPGDVGGGVRAAEHTVYPKTSGACAVTLWSEDDADTTGVAGELAVVRVVDAARERADARKVRREKAVAVRVDLTASLVASGADPELQARLRAEREAEEARLRAERDAEARRRRAERDRRRAERRAEEARRRAEADAEARRRRDVAWNARAQLRAELVASGADPTLRDRQRAARLEAERARRAERDRLRAERDAERDRLRAERDAERDRLRAERDAERDRRRAARLEAERVRHARARRITGAAIAVRGELTADLVAAGADPDYRAKRDLAELRAFEARARAERTARLEAEARLAARTRVALSARAELVATLHAAGAVERPPRPAPPVVERPPRPFEAAVWTDGYYTWSAGAWLWIEGSWSSPPVSGAVWVAPAEVVIEGVKVLRPGGWIDRDGKRVRVRDHRD